MTKTKTLLALAALATSGGTLLLGAGPAMARDVTVVAQADEAPIAHVSYADLNLAVAAGQRTLERRVSGAITQVCQDTADGTDRFANGACVNAAWNEAIPQMKAATARARALAEGGASTDTRVALNAIRIGGGQR